VSEVVDSIVGRDVYKLRRNRLGQFTHAYEVHCQMHQLYDRYHAVQKMRANSVSLLWRKSVIRPLPSSKHLTFCLLFSHLRSDGSSYSVHLRCTLPPHHDVV